MDTTRVFASAARKLGMLLLASPLFLRALGPPAGGEIVAPVMSNSFRMIGALALIAVSVRAQPSKIYVLSTENGSKVTTYTADGKPSNLTIGLGGCACTGLAVDAANKIYVTQNGSGDLISFLPDGKRTAPFLNGEGKYGVALDTSGKIYVLDFGPGGGGIVRTFTASGLPTTPTIITGLSNPSGLAVDASGKIYVVSQGNDIVKTYSPTGQEVGPTIQAGVNTPRAIAIGPDGRVYIANFLNVTTYLANGQRTLPTITHINPATWGLDTPMGLAVDSNGKIYVGYNSGALVIYNPDGKQAGPVIAAPRGIWSIAVR